MSDCTQAKKVPFLAMAKGGDTPDDFTRCGQNAFTCLLPAVMCFLGALHDCVLMWKNMTRCCRPPAAHVATPRTPNLM